MAVSYVRFLRGTPTAFSNVATKDPDTLYFISETNATTGDLYLGSKLISGKGVISTVSIGDLADVITGVAPDNGSILVFDENQGMWVAKTPLQVAQIIYQVMTGASASSDGTSGMVPAPSQGQQNLFLRGDATWADPTAALTATVNTLIGTDTNQSIRQIATEVLTEALIPENAQESLDTLIEIADWIQDHPAEAAEYNTRITNLEETVYDVVDPVTGDTVSVGLVTTVGDLSTAMTTLQSNVTDLTTDVRTIENNIVNINNRLRWHEIDNSGNAD